MLLIIVLKDYARLPFNRKQSRSFPDSVIPTFEIHETPGAFPVFNICKTNMVVLSIMFTLSPTLEWDNISC